MTQLKTWHVFYNAIVTLNMVVGITQSDLLAQFGLEGWVGMMGKSVWGGGGRVNVVLCVIHTRLRVNNITELQKVDVRNILICIII